jgi:release factor glutamine methyltransferase
VTSATLAEAWREATKRLAAAGIEAPQREARILMAHAMGGDLAALLRQQDDAIGHNTAEIFSGFIARRAAREPAATILGRREFWSLDFLVSPRTLIPRPDSETIIEAAIALFPESTSPRRILDLGTGTGCLLLATLSEFTEATGIGIDRSEDAASVAALNAERLGLSARAAFIVGDWTEALNACFDLILSNPPYIPAAEIAGLQPEVVLHEPLGALDGGPDGLDAYRRIFRDLPAALTPKGIALFEFGRGQEASLPGLAHEAGLEVLGTRSDLAGHPRVLILRRLQKEVGFLRAPV